MRRQGKLSSYEFAVLMAIGQAGLKHPSLSAMVQALEGKLSREGLHQRFTPQAVAFMHACLNETLRNKFPLPESLGPRVLQPFDRVMVFDSSSWDVDPSLDAVFRGSGGEASAANCKLQAAYEYKGGELNFFQLSEGTRPDQAHSAILPDQILKGDLVLMDMGYFRVGTFSEFHQKGAFYLSRFRVGTTLRCPQTAERINLPARLLTCDHNVLELNVIMSNDKKAQTPCRLICLKVSEPVANERRRKMHQRARKQGRTPSQESLTLCDWTVLVTNIPTQWLPATSAYYLYAVRWQIELLFKQLKSILRIHQSNTARECRLRCELYGKLLMAVLVHRVHAVLQRDLWNTQRHEVSFDKLHKRFQERAFLLMGLILRSLAAAIAYLQEEIPRWRSSCAKAHQPSRLSTLQRLDQIFPPEILSPLA